MEETFPEDLFILLCNFDETKIIDEKSGKPALLGGFSYSFLYDIIRRGPQGIFTLKKDLPSFEKWKGKPGFYKLTDFEFFGFPPINERGLEIYIL
jgi:hypothetical protein